MSDVVRLSSPRLLVAMADGTEHEIQTLNPDLIRYDVTRAKHKWPEGREAPFLWLTFLAWAALRREGVVPETLTWTVFSETECLSVKSIGEEDEETGAPFPGDQEPGSLSS